MPHGPTIVPLQPASVRKRANSGYEEQILTDDLTSLSDLARGDYLVGIGLVDHTNALEIVGPMQGHTSVER